MGAKDPEESCQCSSSVEIGSDCGSGSTCSTVSSGSPSSSHSSMPSSWLPTEIYRYILSLVPTTSSTSNHFANDTRARVLARFGLASTAFRSITTHPPLWEECYRARYTMQDAEREKARRERWTISNAAPSCTTCSSTSGCTINSTRTEEEIHSGSARIAHEGQEPEDHQAVDLGSGPSLIPSSDQTVDWRLLYIARRKIDMLVMTALRALASDPEEVDRVRAVLDEYGFDVWDALEEVVSQPLLLSLRTRSGTRGESSCEDASEVGSRSHFEDASDSGMALITDSDSDSPQYDLTLRYWSKEVQCVLCRREAISIWQRLRRVQQLHYGGLPSPPLDPAARAEVSRAIELYEALAGLSAFWGVPIAKTLAHFDELAKQCKEFLRETAVNYVRGDEGYIPSSVCVSICAFMRSRGYDKSDGSSFANLYNNFPHHFLTTHRRSLPLSLVCTFVSISRRLGLPATPINSVGRVTAYLDGVVVDVYDSATNAIVMENTAHPVPMAIMQGEYEAGEMVSVTTVSMLLRSGRNIMNSLSECAHTWADQSLPSSGQGNRFERVLAEYASDGIFASLSSDAMPVLHPIAESMQSWFPLDFELVVRDRFFPALQKTSRELLMTRYAEGSTWRKARVRTPYMRYFVGQIVKVVSRPFQYWLVMDWNTATTNLGEEEVKYDLLGDRGVKLSHATAESVMQPANCSASIGEEFLTWNPHLARSFCDFEFTCTDEEQEQGRARFVMNEYTSKVYPEDDVYGTSWMGMPGRKL